MMSELRQRRRKNTSSAEEAAPELNVSKIPHKSSNNASTRIKKITAILLFLCYIPILVVINPITVPIIYYKLFPTVCQGICSLESLDADNTLCSPVNPTKLIFLRIPKTGSSTVTSLFKSQANVKSTISVDLGEIENLVPSLPISNNHNGNIPQGYYDPSIQATQSRLVQFYKQSSLKVLTSTLNGRDRVVFDGHFRYYNYLERGYKYVSPIAEWRLHLPQLMQELYNHLPTNEELAAQNSKYGIPTISFVRQPYERLSSMYYFDRSQARNIYWRKDFIQQRGNVTLDECLTNSTCVEVNELQRWCNIQTEMLCGVEKECMEYPLGKKALEIAKRNIKDELLFVGVTERMNESVSILEKILPTYLEGISDIDIVHKNVGEARQRVRQKGNGKEIFSKEAKKVLKDICSLDLELYEYVDKMLTQRVEECL